jgi:hypothetical protein
LRERANQARPLNEVPQPVWRGQLIVLVRTGASKDGVKLPPVWRGQLIVLVRTGASKDGVKVRSIASLPFG